jgi:hypothetical protein
MHELPMGNISRDFANCWQAAGLHLQACLEAAGVDTENVSEAGGWLKAELRPPFLEHFSFRLWNQIFFIRLEDVAGDLEVPASRDSLKYIADSWKAQACLMPMVRENGQWRPKLPGWGLTTLPAPRLKKRNSAMGYGIHISGTHRAGDGKRHGFASAEDVSFEFGQPVDPTKLVTAEKIEMTDWELQDFAVQVVRQSIPHHKLMSWNTNPQVQPSLWFAGDDGPEWVIVKALRYPEKEAGPPDNLAEIEKNCARRGRKGHLAIVNVASGDGGDDPFEPGGRPYNENLPLYRGHSLYFGYKGLKALSI